MKKNAACTIISKNYLPYARTLYNSFHKQHPNDSFFVLLVDRIGTDIDPSKEDFEIVEVESLAIPDFPSISFTFDILELNTNVKPAFLKYLLLTRKFSKVIYFDPDIRLFHPMTTVYNRLTKHSMVLTPHCLRPITDGKNPSERGFLSSGIFNLGFIGVNNSKEAISFLSWWEDRCLNQGFDEQATGLFVDQKWMNLAPCFFDTVHILKDPGYNMAYWNLHERSITSAKGGKYSVNGAHPLVFYHFSGLNRNDRSVISKYQNRFDFKKRRDIKVLFDNYWKELEDNGLGRCDFKYHFGFFSNGDPVNNLIRKVYAIKPDLHSNDPFNTESKVYTWARKKRLISRASVDYSSIKRDSGDFRVKVLNSLFRIMLRLLGPDRYQFLMKYFLQISVIRNQKGIFDKY